MSQPKTYPPYKVMSEGSSSWIVDAHGNDVITNVAMSSHYAATYESQIMYLICGAMNGRDELLEALEKCLDIIQPPGASVQECWKSVDEIDSAWHAGVAAIAKAKGENQ